MIARRKNGQIWQKMGKMFYNETNKWIKQIMIITKNFFIG